MTDHRRRVLSEEHGALGDRPAAFQHVIEIVQADGADLGRQHRRGQLDLSQRPAEGAQVSSGQITRQPRPHVRPGRDQCPHIRDCTAAIRTRSLCGGQINHSVAHQRTKSPLTIHKKGQQSHLPTLLDRMGCVPHRLCQDLSGFAAHAVIVPGYSEPDRSLLQPANSSSARTMRRGAASKPNSASSSSGRPVAPGSARIATVNVCP